MPDLNQAGMVRKAFVTVKTEEEEKPREGIAKHDNSIVNIIAESIQH
jgi:hypothetical protein